MRSSLAENDNGKYSTSARDMRRWQDSLSTHGSVRMKVYGARALEYSRSGVGPNSVRAVIGIGHGGVRVLLG